MLELAIPILSWLSFILATAIAAMFGGRDGRIAAGLLAAAYLLSALAKISGGSWATTNWPVMAVDGGLLLALYLFALNSRRWWPLWITAFHLLTVTVHLSTLLRLPFSPTSYLLLAALWSLPISLCLPVGVLLDWRAGIRA